MTPPLADHFFRHEYGRLVALLVRRVGTHQLEAIEDAVQAALLAAVESWPRSGVPESPPAWLYRVAHHQLLSELRRRQRQGVLSAEPALATLAAAETAPLAPFVGDFPDGVLRLLFMCCDESIAVQSQLMLALKALCGFDVREIAERLFTTEANVYKRLARARTRLRELPPEPEPSNEALRARLGTVQAALYTLFTEGYFSSHADQVIRRQLCDEALRLATLLAEHPLGAAPSTFALVALFHLHCARLPARQDASGGLLLLEEQDRSRWDQARIAQGLEWLARSAEGDVLSRYHAEAGIAAEHCLAPSLAATRWEVIARSYALLEREAPSAFHKLGQALAVAEWQGPAAGLAILDAFPAPAWLRDSYVWAAVLADLHRRAGHQEVAERYREDALERAPLAVRVALGRRLRTCAANKP